MTILVEKILHFILAVFTVELVDLISVVVTPKKYLAVQNLQYKRNERCEICLKLTIL